MGYAGKVMLQKKARELRCRGLSMREIQKRLDVSKSSVSLWTRDVELTRKQIEQLYRNRKTGQLKGSYVASQNKIKRRRQETEKIHQEARKEFGNFSKRDRFVAGVALYFAEGSKKKESVEFTNSDPHSIIFMVRWLKEFCNVPTRTLRCSIYIHDDLDESVSRRYWSRLTGIPLSRFGKSYVVKNDTGRLRTSRNVHGVARISVHNAALHRRIMGWISCLFEVH